MVTINDKSEGVYQQLVDTKTIARYIGMSVKFVEKHRGNMPDAMKINNRRWRFNLPAIQSKIATGKDIIIPKKKKR